MNSKLKIGILGGDARQAAVCSLFSGKGFECAVWGTAIKGTNQQENGFVRCVDWKDAINGSSAVILPLPLTTDGVRLNCGKGFNDSYVPRINEIIQATDRSTILFAGKVPSSVSRFAAEHNVRLIDYYEFEDFQIKNAVPTAEGAIAVAINEMEITLAGCRAAVVGYGRIGRTLALRLISLGAKVTCIARSKKDLAWGNCDGCDTLKLDGYRESPIQFDVIFNTVPCVIFDRPLIDKISPETLFIDLASANGGIDAKHAEEKSLKVIKALSLPGRMSPASAGKIIFDTISDYLHEVKIL